MNDYVLEEMADAIAHELHVDNSQVLSILHRYWQDKIAPLWQVDDLLEVALKMGKPITKEDATRVLKDIFENHDPELGITWITLQVALQEYHLPWKNLSEDGYAEVPAVFKVWRKDSPIAFQVGRFPDRVQNNLSQALTLARTLADNTPGTPILIGGALRGSDEVEPWLSVVREKEGTSVEETCTP